MTIPSRGTRRVPATAALTRHPATIRIMVGLSVACALASASPTVALAQRTAATSGGAEPEKRCLDTSATIVPARLDETHLIYVEQETVAANRDGRVLVAGAPVFVWRNTGDKYELVGRDSLFGMIVDRSSRRVQAIPSPLPGRALKGMRAAAMSDGWWLATFAEVVDAESTGRRVVAMWAGETDGSRWRAVEKLPGVSDTIDVLRLSTLAFHDGRARLAAPVRRDWRRPVILFSRDAGHWTVRDDDVGFPAEVAIASTASMDLLAVVRPDTTTHREDLNSLFFYTKSPSDTAWTPHPRVWHGKGGHAHVPMFVNEASQPALLWLTGPIFAATSAWAKSLATLGDSASAPVAIPTHASIMVAASRSGAGVIATFARGDSTKDLRLFEFHEPLRVDPVVSRATDYRGLIGVGLTSDRLVLIASKAAEPPRNPAVVSMIETHTWRCQ